MEAEQALVEAALEVLKTADPVEKARLSEAAAIRWLHGDISLPYHPRPNSPPLLIPDRPARLPTVKLVAPHLMPKLGKGGSLHSRQAILHSLVHTESWAIDLSWDIIARFGIQEYMPRDFFSDFVRVAQDEGRHFTLLAARLEELGSFYGAFPAHDGLWDSAIRTSHSLLARLAVEHCVHEARGLDVLPTIISRFRGGGDECTARLLETVVYPEEVTHCAAGIKWFRYVCLRDHGRCEGNPLLHPFVVSPKSMDVEDVSELNEPLSSSDRCDHLELESTNKDVLRSSSAQLQINDEAFVIQTFHSTVREHFRGPLKPPFNTKARNAAGFVQDWYEPLAVKESLAPDVASQV